MPDNLIHRAILLALGASALTAIADGDAPDLDLLRDRGRVIPLTRDDAAADDVFSFCVDADGVRMVVAARGVAQDAGKVYVYSRDGDGWSLEQRLEAPDAVPGDGFGFGAAIDGGTIVVGAMLANEAGPESGRAYVFDFRDGVWTPSQTLSPESASAGDWFGVSCDLDGDTLVVGARHDADGLNRSGSVFVFERTPGGLFMETAKLRPTPHKVFANFGHAVAVDGDRVLSGSLFGNGAVFEDGSATIFERDGTGWAQTATLFNEEGRFEDLFGVDVALDGDRALIGARKRDDLAIDSGAASVFEHRDGAWIRTEMILPTRAEGGQFGNKVALSGELALVGVWFAGVPGPGGEVAGGAAELFRLGPAGWSLAERFTLINPSLYGSLGHDVDVHEGELLLGSYEDDLLGDQSGRAWAVDMRGALAEPCGVADLEAPFGTLNFNDVTAFLSRLAARDAIADLAAPTGEFDFQDLLTFLGLFAAGCP